MITRSLGLLALLWLLAAPVSAQTTQVVCGIRYPVVPGLPPVQDTISKRTITDSIPCMRGGPAISNRASGRSRDSRGHTSLTRYSAATRLGG